MDESWLGWAEIESDKAVVAGGLCSWLLTYHVGKYGIDDGGSIRVARRSVSDMERPQFTEPKQSGYTNVSCESDVRLEYTYSDRGHIRPFRGALQIDVRDGSLAEGDKIEINFGDSTEGSPGIMAQTFREEEHIFKVLVDPFGTGVFEEVSNSPRISIIGGPAEKLEVVAPSQVKIGSCFDVTVRALDSYGNRSDIYAGTVELKADNESIRKNYKYNDRDKGVKIFRDVKLNSSGVHRIKAVDDEGREAESNPIIAYEELPEQKLFWGDMHGQTKQTVGTGSLDEYFTFARDVAALQFSGWQGNDFQVTNELWRSVQEKTKQYHCSGEFITFLGYEWSGLTPAGGDHNIYFLGDEEKIHRSSHRLIEDKSDKSSDRYPISKLWREFKDRDDVMAIPHVGGRHANLDFFDPDMIPLIEVHSHHGTFEWFLEEALIRGLKVGFIAASDDHTCRPGLTFPSGSFTTRGGITAVYAKKLSREGLWDAFWKRRCYGTTGERIILKFNINEHVMGEEFVTNEKPVIHVEVIGTTPIHEIEVNRGLETIYRHKPPYSNKGKLIKIEWMGARVKSRPKKVNWEGGIYLKEGRIIDYKGYSFDYPEQGIKKINTQRIEWKSITGGDSDGVILRIDAPKDSEAIFYSKQYTFKFNPCEIGNTSLIKELGEVNRRIKISTIPDESLPRSLDFNYIDEEPKSGMNPYWIKVTQSDGANAWSSPIYLSYHKKEK